MLSLATTLGLTSLGKSTNDEITELQGGMDPDASEVVFETEDGERISRGFYSSYNPIVIPEVPDKAGTSGKYWSLDGETIATESSIRTAATSGERLVLSPIYTVTLTVDGEAFTISGLGEEFSGIQTHISTEVIIGKYYTISFCGDSNFHYWKMCDARLTYDRLLSTNPVYEFKTATDLHIVASSQRQNMTEVCFLSSENIYESSDYTVNNATSDLIALPSGRPNYSGRIFDGWTINGSGLYSEEEIGVELANRLNSEAPSSLYLVRAHFVVITTPIDVTINFATIEGNRVASIVGDSVTITLSGTGYKTITLADSEIPEGYSVWYWLIGNYSVGSSIENVDRTSYSKTTRINIISSTRPTTFTVVVGEEEIEPVATAAIQPLVKYEDNGIKKMACVNVYFVPSGNSVVEKGVFYTTDPTLVEFLNVEEFASYEGIKRARSTKADLGTVTLTKTMKTDEDLAATWYLRSYIVYQANGVSYVAYSSVHSGNYDSLPYKD